MVLKRTQKLGHVFKYIFFSSNSQESKATSLAQTLENEEKEQMARTEVRSVSSNGGKSVFDITMPPHCNGSSHFQYQQSPSSGEILHDYFNKNVCLSIHR